MTGSDVVAVAMLPEAASFFGAIADACNKIAPLAREGAAVLRELAPMLARLGSLTGPTRRQKKTWRRRVSRAWWTRNTRRDPDCRRRGILDDGRLILPPWER